MFKQVISLLLISLNTAFVSASDFETVLNKIVANNLTIKYADSERDASIMEMKAENTLEAPEITYENLWGAGHLGDKRNFSISQSFDWPGVYRARSEAIRKSETAMNFLRESELLSLKMDVRLLLINIIYTKQKLKATEEICRDLRQLSDAYKKAVEMGNETRLDYNKSLIERISAERKLKTFQGELALLVSSLKVLNGGESVAGLLEELGEDYPEVELSSLKPDLETIREKDPSQAAIRASIEAQRSLVKVENRSLLPGFSVGYLHEWEMGDIFNGFSVSISLPFISGKKKSKAAEMKLKSFELEEDMSLIKIFNELKGEYDNACALKEMIDEYRPAACDDSNIKLLKKALEMHQINFLTYIQEVNFFLTAHEDFHETLYQYQLSIAKLQRYR